MLILFKEDGELTTRGRQIVQFVMGIYLLFIVYICFGPQHQIDGLETPGIMHIGRVVVLLTPFNSLVNLGEVENFRQLFWVLAQNIVNMFLLYPLLFGMLCLETSLRQLKKMIQLAFFMSLSIELTQVLLDLLINANRVFEVDDLWTNTLGGVFAYYSFLALQKQIQRKYYPSDEG